MILTFPWWIQAWWLIRGTMVHKNHPKARINHNLLRPERTAAALAHHHSRWYPDRGVSLAAVTENLDPVAHNRAAWDREVERGNEWTRPVGPDVTARARAGDWSVVLIGYEPVARDWFPADIKGTAVLCLASGGGQQGPVLAAAGG